MRKVKQYNLAFCDEHGCYDETIFGPQDINDMEYSLDELLWSQEECCNCQEDDWGYGERRRLYVYFDDGTKYEIKLVKEK